MAIAGIHLSADLFLPSTAAAAPVSAGATREKLEIQIQLNMVIEQMSTIFSFYCVKFIVGLCKG